MDDVESKKQRQKRVSIMDFVEEDKEEGSPAIKKQVTLDEFFE